MSCFLLCHTLYPAPRLTPTTDLTAEEVAVEASKEGTLGDLLQVAQERGPKCRVLSVWPQPFLPVGKALSDLGFQGLKSPEFMVVVFLPRP